MKNIFEKMGLVESGTPEVPQEEHHAFVPEVHIPMQNAVFPGGAVGGAFNGPQLAPEDTQRLEAMRAQVYAIPSTYTTFQNLRQTLGNTSDLAQVFRIFAAANPGVTAQKVAADIDAHLSIIASKRAEFNATITQARADRIDGPAKEITDLQAENAQLQEKMRQNSARVTDLQKTLADAQRAITDGAARFKAIEDALSAPLVQAKQLLSTLS